MAASFEELQTEVPCLLWLWLSAHSVPEVVTVHLLIDGIPRGQQPFQYFNPDQSAPGEMIGQSVHDQLGQVHSLMGAMLQQGEQGAAGSSYSSSPQQGQLTREMKWHVFFVGFLWQFGAIYSHYFTEFLTCEVVFKSVFDLGGCFLHSILHRVIRLAS